MTPPDQPSEASDPDASLKSITVRIESGDTEAYGAVVRTFEKRVTSFCIALLKNRTAAEEVGAEAFVAKDDLDASVARAWR